MQRPETKKNRATDETRDKLISAALAEISQHGIQGVTLASIRKAAGQANRSVIHYHFKDKESLVEATTERVAEGLGEYMTLAVSNYRASDYQTAEDLPQLAELMFAPFWRYYFEHPEGALGIQFLSRMTWQAGNFGQRLLRDVFKPYFLNFEEGLRRTIPHLDEPTILLRIYMGVNTAIHGLADLGIIIEDPDMVPLLTQQDALENMIGILLRYIAAGIGAK